MNKKITIAAMSLFLMTSCTSQTTGFQINGTVSDSTSNGKEVYLMIVSIEGTPAPIDTAVVEDLKFKFSGEFAEPEVLYVSFGQGQMLLVDNGAVVDVKFGTPQEPVTVTDNGGLNDKLAELESVSQKMMSEMQQTYGKMMQEGASKDSVNAYVNKKQKEIMSEYKKMIETNKDNLLGAYVLSMTSQAYNSVAKLDSAVATVKYAGKFADIKKYRKSLEAKETTSEGRMFVDFDGKNVDGTPAKLSDYIGKGKYVLVDFWASWCRPCRMEIPNLVELQNKFGGKNFQVLGVNVWDKEDEFKKALEAEGINYAQLYASENREATALYGIQGIPQIILFAPDGTILKRDLRGEEMKAYVAEQLAK